MAILQAYQADIYRLYRPTASANPGRSWPLGRNEESRFTATRRGQTAKAFLPTSNVLSSLKTVTATPSRIGVRNEFILIYSRSGSWGTCCLSPATVRPFAASGPLVWDTVCSPLQRSVPVLATCQSSTSHSINPDKDAKGSPSWRRVPLLTIRSGYTLHPPASTGFNLR